MLVLCQKAAALKGSKTGRSPYTCLRVNCLVIFVCLIDEDRQPDIVGLN